MIYTCRLSWKKIIKYCFRRNFITQIRLWQQWNRSAPLEYSAGQERAFLNMDKKSVWKGAIFCAFFLLI